MPIPEKDDNLSDNLGPFKDKKLILERPNIEEDDIDLASKSLDTESYTKNKLLKHTPQAGLLRSELLSFLRKIQFKD